MTEKGLICLMATLFVHDLDEFPSEETIQDAVKSAFLIQDAVRIEWDSRAKRMAEAERESNDTLHVPTAG